MYNEEDEYEILNELKAIKECMKNLCKAIGAKKIKKIDEHKLCYYPKCNRVARVGKFCFIHDTVDPNICKILKNNKICGNPLAHKEEMNLKMFVNII